MAQPFWALAQAMSARMHDALEGVEAYLSMTTLGMVNKEVLTSHRGPPWPQFVLSNLGRLDVPADTSLRVRAIHGATNTGGYGPYLYTTAVGIGGALYLDVVFPSPEVDPAAAEGYARGIVEQLRVAAGGPAR
jgi:hypothetical protein